MPCRGAAHSSPAASASATVLITRNTATRGRRFSDRPSCSRRRRFRSPRVQKITGAINILISLMNASPKGCIAAPLAGDSVPIALPGHSDDHLKIQRTQQAFHPPNLSDSETRWSISGGSSAVRRPANDRRVDDSPAEPHAYRPPQGGICREISPSSTRHSSSAYGDGRPPPSRLHADQHRLIMRSHPFSRL